jgi:hypothetical protein
VLGGAFLCGQAPPWTSPTGGLGQLFIFSREPRVPNADKASDGHVHSTCVKKNSASTYKADFDRVTSNVGAMLLNELVEAVACGGGARSPAPLTTRTTGLLPLGWSL